MLTGLQLGNFKGWEDTGDIRLAPLTLFFGRNSSGKSSLAQALLMMKQTAEALDSRTVLDFGDANSYVDLGTYRDVVFRHDAERHLKLAFTWPEPKGPMTLSVDVGQLGDAALGELTVYETRYSVGVEEAKMRRAEAGGYELVVNGRTLLAGNWTPVKCFAFPGGLRFGEDSDLALVGPSMFEAKMSEVSYVGPLRERPRRTYQWGGSSPSSVGPRGEDTVAAILARRRGSSDFESHLAYRLRQMGVVKEFAVQEIAPGRDLYELTVATASHGPRMSVIDVGFGVSQALPVLVEVFYARDDATVILEQPEIHLHPAAQSELGDVLIAATTDVRNVQLLVETHSEHLLRRIQRRIAEGAIASDRVALYFVESRDGRAEIGELAVDQYGNIANWPMDFFGDEIGDLGAMTEAQIERRTHGE